MNLPLVLGLVVKPLMSRVRMYLDIMTAKQHAAWIILPIVAILIGSASVFLSWYEEKNLAEYEDGGLGRGAAKLGKGWGYGIIIFGFGALIHGILLLF